MLEVGRRALALGEWSEARDAFERQLESDPDAPEALEGVGWALYWLDETDASFDRREAAYRIYVDRDDVRSAARVATAMALDSVDLRGFAVAAGWLARARRLLSAEPPCAELGWLRLWEGHLARAMDHDLEKAARFAREARELGAAVGVSDLELLAQALEGLVKVTEGNVRDGMRQLDEATAAAVSGEITDLDSVAATCCFLVHACERVRDYDRAAQWGERIQALAGRWRMGSIFTQCEAEYAAMLIGRGEWEVAEEQLQRALVSLEARRPLVTDQAVAHIGDLRRRQGRTAEALELFARVESNTLAMLGTAAIALDRGDALRCATLAERLIRRPMAEKWVERAMAFELLIRARIALASTPSAAAAGIAEPLAGIRTAAAKVGTGMVRAIAASCEAAVAAAAGDHAQARVLLEDAVDLYERSSAPWEAARARIDLAEALRHLGREAFAREELAAARDSFTRLGAAAESARVVSLLEDVVRAPRGAQSPLTPRETEVLRLVARGMSDKEAAAELRLSEHTVHRHVANILGKLSAPSRAAAATEAARQGWI